MVVVRPDTAAANALPPPVLVEEVLVDGQIQIPKQPAPGQSGLPILKVPPGKGRLEIHYTALSFSAPEKVRFKYRMDGLDSGWIDGSKQTGRGLLLPGARSLPIPSAGLQQ